MSTVNVIMLLTRMGKLMYMQAWLTNSIVICMLALHVTTLKHCHIVAREAEKPAKGFRLLPRLFTEGFRHNDVDRTPHRY